MKFIEFKYKVKTAHQNRFLSGFKVPILRGVVYAYKLEGKCMDLRKRQCLQKVIRSNLTIQEVWKAVAELDH